MARALIKLPYGPPVCSQFTAAFAGGENKINDNKKRKTVRRAGRSILDKEIPLTGKIFLKMICINWFNGLIGYIPPSAEPSSIAGKLYYLVWGSSNDFS